MTAKMSDEERVTRILETLSRTAKLCREYAQTTHGIFAGSALLTEANETDNDFAWLSHKAHVEGWTAEGRMLRSMGQQANPEVPYAKVEQILKELQDRARTLVLMLSASPTVRGAMVNFYAGPTLRTFQEGTRIIEFAVDTLLAAGSRKGSPV